MSLFSTDHPKGCNELLEEFPKTISKLVNRNLTRPKESQEIKNNLFFMHYHKAPGPDDIYVQL